MNETSRYEGRLVLWNPERGFGAIVPSQGGQELFVHVSAFPKDGPPPSIGELVSFEIVSDGEGRKRAARVLHREAARKDEVSRVLAPPTGALALRRRREERRRRIGYALVGMTLAVLVLSWMQLAHPHDEPMTAQHGSGQVRR